MGSLLVTVTLIAAEADPGTFAIALDGIPLATVGANETITFKTVAVGSHSVRIESAHGCTMSETSKTAEVRAFARTEVRFLGTCLSAGTGMIRARVVAPRGTFGIRVDGGPEWRTPANRWLDLFRIAPGERWLAANADGSSCVVAGENPRAVHVRSGAVTSIDFSVECEPPAIVVEVMTEGRNLDPDGYAVRVGEVEDPYCYESCRTLEVPVRATVTFGDLRPVAHYVRIFRLSENCVADPAHYPSVTPRPGPLSERDPETRPADHGHVPGSLSVAAARVRALHRTEPLQFVECQPPAIIVEVRTEGRN